MNEQKAFDLVKWIESFGNTNVKPIKVEIKDEVFYGAQYDNVHSDNEPVLYLLGEIPKCRQKRVSLCFTIKDDPNDWFLSAGYTPHMRAPFRMTELSEEVAKQFHPFGDNWMMRPWDKIKLKSEIDTYERYRYVRVPITVSILHTPAS